MDAATPRDLDQLDSQALRALILALREQVFSHQKQLASRDAEIEHLKLLIVKLRRLEFGRSSEKREYQIEQLELRLEELEARQTKETAAVKESVPPSTVVVRPVRRSLPDHLPREERKVLPKQEACPDCGGKLKHLGEDVSEILEYVPASLKVIRYVRPKLACGCCDRIVQAEAPSRPIERGIAGPGLLAHVLASKYCDHLPLYRQSQIYARTGVELDRSTLAEWVGASSRLLAPLVEALRRHVMAADKLHADDTPVPVLAPGLGKTKTGRLWTYVRDDRPAGSTDAPAVWFQYSPDRKGERPLGHLQHFAGILQADGYAGFERLYARGDVVEAACWAHVRRKFYDLQVANNSPIAAEALSRIGALYSIETEMRGRPPDQRQAARQARAGPLLDDLHAWLQATLGTVSKKSELALALRYAITRWTALTRYCDDGGIEIDNNAAERSLRAVAIGRKNYLFAGSDAGGERAAAFYSLIGTAKLNGLDPEAYLRTVLERIAEHPINRVDELLPWHLASAPAEALRQAA